MTLIITALKEDNIIQVSDRRLTRNGKLYDDSANKIICVSCADASFSIAYTGLGEIHGCRTDKWVFEYLLSIEAGTLHFNCKPLRNLKSYLEEKGVRYEYLHTSGHAKLEDMKKLVDAITPEILVPIHSFYPDKFKDYFKNVKLMNDGEIVNL